jgi:Cu(I)/Ag(I) efflux system membrane protein CusA/SilA
MVLLVRGRRLTPEAANPVSRFFTSVYSPLLRTTLRWRRTALLANVAVVLVTFPLLFGLGREFMPPLYEGSLLYMPTAPPGLSVTLAGRLLQVQDRILADFPEVDTVFGTAGRATTATDNSPMGMVNTTITLKPRHAWRPGLTPGRLQEELDDALRLPGLPNIWTQPIRNRLDMLSTGIKTPVGIKILGADLNEIQRIGERIEQVLGSLPATRSVYAERVAQGYFADVQIDRHAIARHGLLVEDVEDVIQAAVGGQNVTRTIEGRERYPVNVRYERALRQDLPDVGRVLVKTPAGAHVPLSQLARLAVVPGPAMIRDENGRLAGYVYIDTGTRDVVGYVEEARRILAARVRLPAGYTLQWAGQYEMQVRARNRLRIVIPLVCIAIFTLLWLAFRSASEAALVMLSVVYAMTGGLLAQWWLGYPFSVAVWVGYIALFGLAVQTGVVMVMYLHEALDRRLRHGGDLTADDVREATIAGSILRLRPKLMTVSVVILSMVPIFWSTGAGADILRPIAAPIVGGMFTSTIHVLVITPLMFDALKTRALRRGRLKASRMMSPSGML